ncbi:GNAT family acetyltransferase [Pseudalgibacter alginicilyticus]|uniref:GNAT family acetyltransferase n=1 Tax=Pseudalgibacter alginicilyticus TaxID=1736674 RepID=A0A0P0D089_9FLAO|nr:GNAT family N-acetyltransferase [Pseudalgibacter alginicilyticus]ALJ04067.1 GNAT family acetyltransferase [Pseudalgibacter alginicilyticus]
MTFRKANKNDLASIIELFADDALGKTREQFKTPLPESYIKAFEIINADKNQELMVVENNVSEVIATFQLTFIQYMNYCGGLRAQVESVQVRKDQRGLGVGKKIFEWAISRSKEKKAHILQLTSDKKRPKAIEFYKKLGFIDSHEGMKLHLK